MAQAFQWSCVVELTALRCAEFHKPRLGRMAARAPGDRRDICCVSPILGKDNVAVVESPMSAAKSLQQRNCPHGREASSVVGCSAAI